ncbi:MAG: RNA polymerase sigma-70 factor [Saprospiraceae bacterium]
MEQNEAFHLFKVQNGDIDSFRWFYDCYHSKIYHYCFRYIRKKEIVDEITSDVFVKFWNKRTQLNSKKSASGLLYKIARDYCIDRLRKIARNEELKNSFLEHYEESLLNPIEEDLYFKESLQVINVVINTLPPKRKQVFQMRYQSDMTNDQIAKELDISPNTVKVHLTKASNFIRNYIFTHSDVVYILFPLCSLIFIL